MKQCKVCNEELTDNNWYPSSKKLSLFKCKTCSKQQSRESYKKYSVEEILYFNAQQRARKKNLEFNIEVSDIVVPKLCPVYGVPLERATGSRGASEFSPTLDRFDSSKGYIKGNVGVISWKANRLKSNGTAEDFRLLLEWLK